MMSALKGMFSFFTMIRLDTTQEDMDAMDRNFWMVPMVGVFYGLIAAIMMTALVDFFYVGTLAAAVVTFFMIFCINRFLHIDGTADVGDGLVVAGTQEDHLRALKDSRIGAGGMAFALMIILASLVMAASVPILLIAFALFSAEVLAKTGMVSAAAFGEPGEEGMASNCVRNTTSQSLLFATVLSAVLISAFCVLIHILEAHTSLPVALPGSLIVWFVLAFAVAILAGAFMAWIAKRNFGMVNGDVLGATNEITRAAVLLTLLIFISVI
ncbi:MAG: adenosylcobinamide-GDP ribazoletransferase [Methanomassiliicoccaceae archaeon]|nr:adenosylcobinamide-GDP ribazoletransferase [Methanomassiliicoccaceae archaeon]